MYSFSSRNDHVNKMMKLILMLVLMLQLFISSTCASSQFNSGVRSINPITLGIRSAIQSNALVSQLSSSNNNNNNYNKSNRRNNNVGRLQKYTTRKKHGYTFGKSPRRIYNIANDDDDDDNNNNYEYSYDGNCSNEAILTSNREIINVVRNNNHEVGRNAKQRSYSTSSSSTTSNTNTRGGGGTKTIAIQNTNYLNFWENMICGAVSRSVAQIATHPANTMKTLLQSNRNTANKTTLRQLAKIKNLKMLTRGAGAQLVLSIPQGAVNFAVLEYVRKKMIDVTSQSEWASRQQDTNTAFGPLMDFLSSAVATICCSVVATPQMMIVDNIMAGTYPNLAQAVRGLSAEKGILGFYSGWWPGLAGKIPSYALTWTFFQRLKQLQLTTYQRPPKGIENSMMGCMAGAASVSILIPLDTIKTRLVTQMNYPDLVPYKGIADAAVRIFREEGIGTFYRGLPPRLISVVPMVGIQFGAYEFMKKFMLSRRQDANRRNRPLKDDGVHDNRIESVIMEVAANDDQPVPVPHFIEKKKRQKIR